MYIGYGANPKLITGNANPGLSSEIIKYISILRGQEEKLVNSRVERFNDEEVYVEVYENVRGEDMYIIQSSSKPANDNLMEILIIADTLRRSSAARITAVMPYFGYARQDRRTRARTPISAKLVANLIAGAGIDRVLTMDLHSSQIQGFFDIPVDNLFASPLFELDIKEVFRDRLENLVIVSPDVGGVTRARELAKRIDVDLAVIDKRRDRPGEIAEISIIGNVKGRICILVDDMCDTAGTLCLGAEHLMEEGATNVHAYVTHGVLSHPARMRIEESVLDNLVLTDSIEIDPALRRSSKYRILSAAPLLARAIINISKGSSVSSLFDAKNLEWFRGNRELPLMDAM
ncbi:MAG: ribose-phosphate pyrophosphokinase [Rhodobacteraceae bacterium]|nr:ribose-phosphate pyrophosphokinase [Paracoccaceae bacterium]